VRTLFWKFPSIAGSQRYEFGFDSLFRRLPLAYKTKGALEQLFFINGSKDVNGTLVASGGGIYTGTNNDFSTELSIPPLGEGFTAYSLGIPELVEENTTRVKVKTYLLNTGSSQVDSATVFTSRGDLKECSASLASGQSLECTLQESPLEGEDVQNKLRISLTGLDTDDDLDVTYTIGSTPRSCDLRNLGPDPECAKYTACTGNLCSFRRCGDFLYCEETTPNPELYARVDVSTLGAGDSLETRLSLWNWYLNSDPLWNSKDPHSATFTTKEPEPYFPATVYYTFGT